MPQWLQVVLSNSMAGGPDGFAPQADTAIRAVNSALNPQLPTTTRQRPAANAQEIPMVLGSW
jgi:hypothetical protein